MSEAAAHAEEYTTLGLPHRKVGFWTFIGSECMFFGSLIGTYLAYRGKSLQGPFPEETFSVLVTSISTFTLLTSSLAMVLALHYVQVGSRRLAGFWLLATALLGLVFLGFQSFEFTDFYRHGLTLNQNLFGTTFFVLTGFHGAHVSGGVLWLLSLFVINARGLLTPERSLDVEICGIYWHFVDIVWIVIFTVVYLLEFVR
jgi:heme/copper-type cytochrome/quinol oxidase subunit 3